MPVFYDCQRCTACCRWPGEVKLREGETQRLAEFLGISEWEFIQRYTRLRSDRQALALEDQADGSCVFLDGEHCRVQPVKPQQCRDFPNRWNFPGFEKSCHAIPREVSDAEYARLLKALGVWTMLAWLLLGLGSSEAIARDVWQLGTLDASPAEFRPWIHPTTGERQIDYADPRSDAVFVIGQSDPAQHWPAFQPGSASGGAGFREHPATLLFDFSAIPRADLRLHIAMVTTSARLPLLQVDLNGHRGLFYQRPQLAYSAGDTSVFFQPHYSTSTITCDLPRDWFRAGTNRLVLTALDDPPEREDVRPLGFPWPGCSGILYDAIRLEEPENDPQPALFAELFSTPFHYRRNGALWAEVEVLLRFRSTPTRAEVSLEIGGERFPASLPGHREFGEARLRFQVPAWEGIRPAVLRMHSPTTTEWRTELRAARRWEVWVVPHEHLDIGYTDHDAKIAELHSRVLDDALDLTDRLPDFRFTADGFWVIEEYLAGRSASARDRLVQALRDQRVFVPAVHGSLFTGSASLEGLIRNLYPSHRFARAHGTPFDTAIITDVPSFSWSFASVLAAAGVRNFVGASDAYRGPFLLHNRLNERSPHAWEGPDGGRVTTWYSRHYHQMGSLFGMPPRISYGRDALPRFLQAYDRPNYPSNAVLLYGTQVENVALEPAQAEFVREWNATYAYPHLQYGGFATAMAAVTTPSNTLPVVRGDGGPYWEDGLAANARVTALARRNAHRLPSAEKALTAARSINPRFELDPALLESAWRHSRLIDEHTWHADCSVRDPDSDQARKQGEAKDSHATEAERALERGLRRSLSAAADALPALPGSLLVFNPLSWPRADVVETEIGRGQGIVDPRTGTPLPFEILRTGRVYQRIRLAIPTIPGLGFTTLSLRPLPLPPAPQPAAVSNVVENDAFRVEWDLERGGVRRLLDKRSGRELVDANSPYRLGEWLYVTGGDALPNRLVQYSTVTPLPPLTIHRANATHTATSTLSRLGATGRFVGSSSHFPRIETEIFLPTDRPEVHLTLRVQKAATLAKEAAYVAFPLALAKPRFRYATANGFVDPTHDLLPGAGREWFAIQDWLTVTDESGTTPLTVTLAPVDAPLVTLGDIVRGTWPTEFRERAANVFSYVMSNYTPEGYAAAQGGDFVFHYVLTTSTAFDGAEAARFGSEALTPLELSEVTRSDQRSEAQADKSAAANTAPQVTPASLHVTTWKPAEDGRGTILRLLETRGESGTATVTWHGPRLTGAFRCNAVEDDLEPLRVDDHTVRVSTVGFGITTVRCMTE